MLKLGLLLDLFTYYVICLYHVIIAIFVYIFQSIVRLGAIRSAEIRSSAIFVYILHHFFTSQRPKLV